MFIVAYQPKHRQFNNKKGKNPKKHESRFFVLSVTSLALKRTRSASLQLQSIIANIHLMLDPLVLERQNCEYYRIEYNGNII